MELIYPIFVLLITTSAVQGSGETRQSGIVQVYHVSSWKVITNTAYLEDPGSYDVYGTKVAEYTGRPEQRWFEHVYEDGSMSFFVQGGEYINSFATHKACPECFATNEIWIGRPILPVNDTLLLRSYWSDKCLTNPGYDYLTKESCDVGDSRQIWKIVKET